MKAIGTLHVLTETNLQNRYSHLELTRFAIDGGADTIQFRQKTGAIQKMIETARKMQDLCRDAGVPLIVNDRVDVAMAVNADGVHLGQEDFPVCLARKFLGPDRIIGVSSGTLKEALKGISDGADYVGFGPIYPTGSKPDAKEPQGLDKLTDMVTALSVPVIAIGGINIDNAAEVIRTGAHGIAIISAVCCQEDPEGIVRELLGRVRTRKV